MVVQHPSGWFATNATIECMEHVEIDSVLCGECGQSINESPNVAVEDRQPCPLGESTDRLLEVFLTETFKIYSDLGLKYRRAGVKRPLSEQKHGDSFSTKLGRWMRRSRVIDRVNNRYFESVLDPQTGETMRHCDEPLSEHQRHGSAKTTGSRTAPQATSEAAKNIPGKAIEPG